MHNKLLQQSAAVMAGWSGGPATGFGFADGLVVFLMRPQLSSGTLGGPGM
jgi:hypothetical protein